MTSILSLLVSLLLIHPIHALWKGTTVQQGQFPASVLLGSHGDICSGALISPTKVLTTASCVSYPGIMQDSILLQNTGSHHPRMIKIKKIVVHPDYQDYNAANDIAVIVLESTVDWVGHAHLPPSGAPLPRSRTKATVVAWGTSTSGPQYVSERVSSFRSCSDTYEDLTLDASSNICSYSAHACQGDVGGMLISQETKELVGLVVSMEKCQKADAHDVHVAVAPFVDWIESV